MGVTGGGVRIGVAWDDGPLVADPTWSYLTDDDNLVASYDIERGNPSEFERTGGSDATVRIWDRLGLLDPTNTTGPVFGKIQPGVQIQIELWNPCASEYQSRFRGWIDEYDYDVQPWVRQNPDGSTVGLTGLTLECFGPRELMDRIQMQPGAFGDTPPKGHEGQVFFFNEPAHDRIAGVFDNAGVPADFFVVFTLNVEMQSSIYSASETANQPIQDAADAEFPILGSAYGDRFGRLVVHGRAARFDPATVAAGAGADTWDFHHWKVGDEAAVRASIADTAQLRRLAFNRGWKFIRNSGLCTPSGIPEEGIPDLYVQDLTSIGEFGFSSWSSENLLIESGTTTGNTKNDECLMFTQWVIANFAQPRNRITDIQFMSMRPDDDRAPANWELLAKIDIGDLMDVTVHGPGNTADQYIFNAEPFFVEGIREHCEPADGDFAMVTLNLDLSPQAYFTVPLGGPA